MKTRRGIVRLERRHRHLVRADFVEPHHRRRRSLDPFSARSDTGTGPNDPSEHVAAGRTLAVAAERQ
jgi:hypothetical protein